MADADLSALQRVHTGTKDVLAGYETLEDRAEPEIQSVVQDLKSMHQRHASDLERRLASLGEPSDDGKSIQGTVNQATVTLRDWVTTLDEDALSFVRDGEEQLMEIYDKAIQNLSADGDPETGSVLKSQYDEIGSKVRQLPES